MSTLIKDFSEISLKDVPIVGGKNASSGEMFNHLSSKGIRVPVGFATTASAFWEFIDNNNLREPLLRSMGRLNKENFSNLKEIGREARELILLAKMPIDISNAVTDAYRKLCEGNLSEVAVRSSATAEDLPQASFAGQHESFLNIKGEKVVINQCRSVLLLFIQTGPSNTGRTMDLTTKRLHCRLGFKKWFVPTKHAPELVLRLNLNRVSGTLFI